MAATGFTRLSCVHILWMLLSIIHIWSVARSACGNDLWSNGWVKSPQNPVLSLTPGSFDSQNIFAPAITKHNGTYYLYYSGGPSGPLTGEDLIDYQLGLATSTDGEHFTKLGQPLLPLGVRDNFHSTPTLLRNPQGDLQLDGSGTWHMFFNGNRADDVEHATSADGIHWTKDPFGPIFQNAYAPNILKVGDEYRMYYIHKPATGNWEVHLATGPDIYSLQPSLANPVLKQSQAWESSSLFYPYVLQDNGVWTMFYAGYWTPGRTAMGTATSNDGVHWTKTATNPVLTPTPGSPYDSLYTSSQAIIRDGDTYRMFYSGRVDTIHKYFSINLATMPTNGPPATTLRWNVNGLGTWDLASNWTAVGGGSTAVPDSNVTAAILGNAIASRATVVVQSPITLKSIQFNSSQSYVLAGTGSLHFAADAGEALIENVQGSHQIQIPVSLDTNTAIHAAAGTTLEINNRLSLNGHNLLKSGAGTLALNNVVTTGGGQIIAMGGLVSGSALLEGDLVNDGGIVSPGNSPGRIVIVGDYRQGPDGQLRIELAGRIAGIEYDVLEASSGYFDGMLQVLALDGFQPHVGDIFHVLRFQHISGTFQRINLPSLSSGNSWDISELYSAGVVRVVPEPGCVAQCVIGVLVISGLIQFSRGREAVESH